MGFRTAWLALFSLALALGASTPARAGFEDFVPQPKNTPSPVDAKTKEAADRLRDLAKKSNQRQLDFLKSGAAKTPVDALVDLRMSALEGFDKKKEIGALALDPDLRKAIQKELVKNEIRKDPEKVTDEKEKKAARDALDKMPSIAEMEALLKKRAEGNTVDLSADQMKDLAAVLQLEQRHLTEGGKYEDLVKKQLLDELKIQSEDSPNEPPRLPRALLDRIKSEYVKAHPDEKEKVEKDGLTSKQVHDFLKASPSAVAITPGEALKAAADLGKFNFETGGRAFSLAHAGALFRNDTGNPLTKDVIGALNPAPQPSVIHPPGKLFDLGKGPPTGTGGGHKGGGSSGSFRQSPKGPNGSSPKTLQDFGAIGFPDGPAFLTKAERDMLRAMRGEKRPGGEIAMTSANSPGIIHCSLTNVSKSPEQETAAALAQPPGAMCPLRSLLAKHCVEGEQLTGITITGVSQVAQYRVDLETQGQALVNGNDDHALITTMIPCRDFANIRLVRPMTPAEFAKSDRFAVMLNRNCNINSSEGGPNHCLIMAEATKRSGNSAFVTFNSAVPGDERESDPNHGEHTQQGDSGGGVFAKINGETVVMGDISNVLVGHPLGEGRVGGAGSGSMLNWLSNMLPGFGDNQVASAGFQDLRSARGALEKRDHF